MHARGEPRQRGGPFRADALETSNSDAPTLDEFVEADDLALYGPAATSDSSLAPPKGSLPPRTPQKLSPHTQAPPSPTPSPGLLASAIFTPYSSEPPTEALSLLLPLCTLLLPNSSSDPSLLTRPFSEESLPTLEAALRPGWDAYFMLLASLASLRSNCMVSPPPIPSHSPLTLRTLRNAA